VIPPENNADFVARMEDILDLYHEPYDPLRPVVCFDECPVHLRGDGKAPLPAKPGRDARYDYTYKRNGTRNLFVYSEPLVGWREITVTNRRTKQDWANAMHALVEQYPDVEIIRVVLDNLNTHRPGALYETYPPAEARRILERLEFHFTPVHGSWLNMAEIEINVLTRQCLDRRIPDAATLRSEVAAWASARNEKSSQIEWQFTTEDARTKLYRLYPSIDD